MKSTQFSYCVGEAGQKWCQKREKTKTAKKNLSTICVAVKMMKLQLKPELKFPSLFYEFDLLKLLRSATINLSALRNHPPCSDTHYFTLFGV